MKKIFERLPWQIIFAAFLAIFFLRNLFLPLIADDYSYAFIWDGDGRGNLIDGLGLKFLSVGHSTLFLQNRHSHYNN